MGLFRRKRKSLESTEGNFNTNSINYDVINNITNKAEIDRQLSNSKALANTSNEIETNNSNLNDRINSTNDDFNNAVRNTPLIQNTQSTGSRGGRRGIITDGGSQDGGSQDDTPPTPPVRKGGFKIPKNAFSVVRDHNGNLKEYYTMNGTHTIRHLVGDIRDRAARQQKADEYNRINREAANAHNKRVREYKKRIKLSKAITNHIKTTKPLTNFPYIVPSWSWK